MNADDAEDTEDTKNTEDIKDTEETGENNSSENTRVQAILKPYVLRQGMEEGEEARTCTTVSGFIYTGVFFGDIHSITFCGMCS